MSLAAWIALFYVGNLFDLLSTYRGMRGLSEEEMKKRELNPIVGQFIHNKKLSYIFKFTFSSLVVVMVLRTPGAQMLLEIFTILIFLVVGSNLLTIFLREKGKLTPGKFLTDKLRFPKFLAYLFLLGAMVFFATAIWIQL